MTDSSDLLDSPHIPDGLIKLGTFAWPRSEARQTLGHLFEKLKSSFMPQADDMAIKDDQLNSISEIIFANEARAHLTTILHLQLDRAYLEWANSKGVADQRRALIHPPMNDDVLADWAGARGFPILKRQDTLDDFADAKCIVIPHLEGFFRRDHAQLTPLLDLFRDLVRYNGRVIVGCNSWAWRFVSQFEDAHLLFAEKLTMPAFGADALATVLERSVSSAFEPDVFTSAVSGEPVFARDAEGVLTDPYFQGLASQSLGLPWVAIEMFLNGMGEAKDSEDTQTDGKMWVKIPSACSLSTSGGKMPSFALHTLLIHGTGTPEHLSKLMPPHAPSGVWDALVDAGFVERHGEKVRCAIGSYPHIRSELGAAGFNLDQQ